ncbi:hypothetical protein D3C84_934650 [compost metagenome]
MHCWSSSTYRVPRCACTAVSRRLVMHWRSCVNCLRTRCWCVVADVCRSPPVPGPWSNRCSKPWSSSMVCWLILVLTHARHGAVFVWPCRITVPGWCCLGSCVCCEKRRRGLIWWLFRAAARRCLGIYSTVRLIWRLGYFPTLPPSFGLKPCLRSALPALPIAVACRLAAGSIWQIG